MGETKRAANRKTPLAFGLIMLGAAIVAVGGLWVSRSGGRPAQDEASSGEARGGDESDESGLGSRSRRQRGPLIRVSASRLSGTDQVAMDQSPDPPAKEESLSDAMARFDVVRRADEAACTALGLSERTRATIRMINGKERRSRFPSGGAEDGIDPAVARKAALASLLGVDGLQEFEAAESLERLRLKSDQQQALGAGSDAGVEPGSSPSPRLDLAAGAHGPEAVPDRAP